VVGRYRDGAQYALFVIGLGVSNFSGWSNGGTLRPLTDDNPFQLN
jgi:hypothetical protein